MSEFPAPLLEIDAAPAYELLLQLAMVAQPDLPPGWAEGAEWLSSLRGRAKPDLLDAVREFAACCDKVFPHLIALAYECPAPRDAPHFIGFLETLEAAQIYLHLLGYHMRYFRRATPAEVMRAAAGGDAEAQRRFLQTSYPDDAPWQAVLRHLLDLGPDRAKADVLELLRRWEVQVFREEEPRLLAILERDAESKRLLQRTFSPEQIIERATNGIEYGPEPGIRRVLLIPSVAARPWVHALDYQDLKIFCYPVADEAMAADRDAPPPRLVSVTKALGDERRLHLLKLLATRPYSLGEIAEYFGVPKTTMHHHLLILRSAGLVRIRSTDRMYVLRLETIPDVSALLMAYLKGEEA